MRNIAEGLSYNVRSLTFPSDKTLSDFIFSEKLNLIYLEMSVGIIINGIMSGDIMSVGIKSAGIMSVGRCSSAKCP